jgi:hypothetical protein
MRPSFQGIEGIAEEGYAMDDPFLVLLFKFPYRSQPAPPLLMIKIQVIGPVKIIA